MPVLHLGLEVMLRRAGNVVALEVGVVQKTIAGESVPQAQAGLIPLFTPEEDAAPNVVFQTRLQSIVPGARSVAVSRDGERRTGEGLDVDVEDLVLQLDIIRRHIPANGSGLPSKAQLELPGIL